MTTLEILAAAAIAAQEKADALIEMHGDNASCGGAWIVIPGRGNFAKEAKASSYFLFPHHGGGFALKFGRIHAQSEFIHIQACQAACEVLQAHGVRAKVHHYVD